MLTFPYLPKKKQVYCYHFHSYFVSKCAKFFTGDDGIVDKMLLFGIVCSFGNTDKRIRSFFLRHEVVTTRTEPNIDVKFTVKFNTKQVLLLWFFIRRLRAAFLLFSELRGTDTHTRTFTTWFSLVLIDLTKTMKKNIWEVWDSHRDLKLMVRWFSSSQVGLEID